MKITSEISTSLTNAGIGRIYHERSLSDAGPLGAAYADWVKANGPRLLQEGGVIVLHGRNQTDEVKLLARAFHLNGAGVRLKSLSQTILTYRRGGEQLDDLRDAPALFLSPAQAGRRACPLEPWDQDFLTDQLRQRVEGGKLLFLHWETDKSLSETDPLYQWWDQGFVDWLLSSATILRADDLRKGAK